MVFAKALVLAGSPIGDRPWPAATGAPKHLFPVGNRPILFHNLEALREAGVRTAAIVAEPRAAGAIARAVGDGADWGMALTVAECDPAGGLRGALVAADPLLGDEPMLVQRGDAVLRERLDDHFAVFERERLDALALRLCPAGTTTAAPSPAPGYLFSPRALAILREARPVASPIAGVRAHGGRVRIEHVEGVLPCHGDQESLLASNRAVLERLPGAPVPAGVQNSTIQGPVDIHPTAVVDRSTLRGPLVVGPGVRLNGAYIGPYTSIGASVEIEGSEIEHSIVLPEARISYVGTRIESSVIGRGARIGRSFEPPGALRLVVGEGAEVVLS